MRLPPEAHALRMQIDNPAPLVVLMRLGGAAGTALGTIARGRYFLICLSAARAKCGIWTRRHAAGRASPECWDNRRDALDQKIKRIVEFHLAALDFLAPVSGKAQCDKAGIGAHSAATAVAPHRTSRRAMGGAAVLGGRH